MGRGEQRTFSHVVADVGVKFVELLAAEAGFVTLVVPEGADYGYDLPLITFDSSGRPENGYVMLQVRSSRRIRFCKDGSLSIRVKRKHLRLWLAEPMPVVLIRFDRRTRQAYWVYIQQHVARLPHFRVGTARQVITLRVQPQMLTPEAIKSFAALKNRVIMQIRKAIRHE